MYTIQLTNQKIQWLQEIKLIQTLLLRVYAVVTALNRYIRLSNKHSRGNIIQIQTFRSLMWILFRIQCCKWQYNTNIHWKLSLHESVKCSG